MSSHLPYSKPNRLRPVRSVFLIALTCLIGSLSVRAQVMNNKGAVIVVKLAGFMQVNGDYRNYSAGNIDDSGIVTITTHFTNDAAAFSGGSGWYNIGGN